jgi:hypothetical protein
MLTTSRRRMRLENIFIFPLFFKEYDVLGRNTMQSGSSTAFRKNILPPFSGLKIKKSKWTVRIRQQTFNFRLSPAFFLVICLTYSSNLKIEALFSSENSVNLHLTTLSYVPEHSTLHTHCCEILKCAPEHTHSISIFFLHNDAFIRPLYKIPSKMIGELEEMW